VAYKACPPPEWSDGEQSEFKQMLEKLLRRRKRVTELISDVRRAKQNPFPKWM